MLKVKDIKEFMKHEFHLYASHGNLRFLIALQAGPSVERYIVTDGSKRIGFTKLQDAVKLYNDISLHGEL